jgi:ABC-type multidrug transport system fused ATPase/permease subunit
MFASFKTAKELVAKTYRLARPFGRWKLLMLLGLSVVQGLFQVVGVTSIFPFLALAAEPERFRESRWGSEMLSYLPPMDDSRLLLLAGCFAILMLVVSSGIGLLGEVVRSYYGCAMAHWLRSSLLRDVASRPYTEFLGLNSGVLQKVIHVDVGYFTSNIVLALLDMFSKILTILLLVVAVVLVDPGIALGSVAVIAAVYGIIFFAFKGWRNKISDKLKIVNRGIFVESEQMLGGIKPVKVHCREQEFLDRFKKHSSRQAKLYALVPVLSNSPRYLIEPLAFGGLVGLVLFYVARGDDFASILPGLGVIALAGYRLLPAIQSLYGQLSMLGTARHSLEEVYSQTLQAGRRAASVTASFAPHPKPLKWSREIRLQDLSFQYPGASSPVINRLNLVVPKNTSLGITGTTGAGKSTLVDLILGLHVPTAGCILVDGVPLGLENIRAWRSGIGYVPQEIYLLDDTVAANIAFGVPPGDVDYEQLRAVARAAQILEFIEHELPLGFQTTVGERGVRLSGGQRQRIGLARALYHRPELLILDEATSALDTETEKEVMKAIDALHGSMTIIIITHRLGVIQLCPQRLDLAERSRGSGSI